MASSINCLIVEDLSQQHLTARMLAAVLAREGCATRLADFSSGTKSCAIVDLARMWRADLVIICLVFANRLGEHLELISSLRRELPGAHLALAGHLPSVAPEIFLRDCPPLDSVLCGEPEMSAANLAHAVRTGSRPVRGPVPGPDERVSPPLGLDSLPFPLRPDGMAFRPEYGFATVASSRGCYHACSFCLPRLDYQLAGAPYRLRSISHLVGEIQALYDRGARLFLFDDEQFFPPDRPRGFRKARAEEFGIQLEKRTLDIAFTIKARPDELDETVLSLLRDAGLARVYLGVESGCEDTLRLLNKGTTVSQNIDALCLLDRLGLVADFQMLLFHPWATATSLRKDIDFLQQVVFSVPTLFMYRELEIYAGTSLGRLLDPGGRCAGPVLSYTVEDARAELVRRMVHFVFPPEGRFAALSTQLTQAWYDVLVHSRLCPSASDMVRRERLRGVSWQMNFSSLQIVREMVDLAESTGVGAEQVNSAIVDWVMAVNIAAEQGLEQIEAG